MWLPLQNQHAHPINCGSWLGGICATSISQLRTFALKEHVQESRDDGWSLPELRSTLVPSPISCRSRLDPLYPLAMSATAVLMYCLLGGPPGSQLGPPLGTALLMLLPGKGCFRFWLKQQPFCLQPWQRCCSSLLYAYELQGWQLCNFLIKKTCFILPLTAGDPGPVNDWQMPSIFISSSILAFLYF